MKLRYLFLLALCVLSAVAHRTRGDANRKRLQRSDQDNALAEVSDSEASSLEEDALVDPFPDDENIPKESPKWGNNGRRKNRRWRKNKCRYENKTEGAAEDDEINNEQNEVKCERCRGRGCRRRGNKDMKDSNEDQNENKHYRHRHHHHCNRTELNFHGQDGNFERHHRGWRKYGCRNQTDDQDNNQVENGVERRGRYHHRGYHHRGNMNENVHDPEWHKNHNVDIPEGNSHVGRRGHYHHHHHHHHCHNRTTTTSTTPTPPPTSVAPNNDDLLTEFDVRVNVE